MGIRSAWRALVGAERKASSIGPLLALAAPGRLALMPRRYDTFAEEGYRNNVVVYRAVNEVSRGLAAIPWRLFQRNDTAIATHPLLQLLARPNPAMGRGEFFEAVVGFLLIAGNSFIEAVGPDGAAPKELFPLRPDRVTVLKSDTGLPGGYRYKVGAAERTWPVDPVNGRSAVRHVRLFHPLDDWYGLSPIAAAALAIDQRNEADKWNLRLLQNQARPSGALLFRPGEGSGALDPEQYARLKEQIEAQFTGAANAGRPMLLEGGLDWKEMSLSPRDLDWLQSKHATSRDIALAFGVPPQLLGIPGDNTYSNYQEARLALWEETIVPLAWHLRDELNAWLTPMFDDGLRLDLDLDMIPALMLRRERRWRMLKAAAFLTVNEKRAALGCGPLDGGDALRPEVTPRGARVSN